MIFGVEKGSFTEPAFEIWAKRGNNAVAIQSGAFHSAFLYVVWPRLSYWNFMGNNAYIRRLVGVLSGGWWAV